MAEVSINFAGRAAERVASGFNENVLKSAAKAVDGKDSKITLSHTTEDTDGNSVIHKAEIEGTNQSQVLVPTAAVVGFHEPVQPVATIAYEGSAPAEKPSQSGIQVNVNLPASGNSTPPTGEASILSYETVAIHA